MDTGISVSRFDVYAHVTGEIVKAIEAGIDDYKMPWHQAAGAGRRNAATGTTLGS